MLAYIFNKSQFSKKRIRIRVKNWPENYKSAREMALINEHTALSIELLMFVGFVCCCFLFSYLQNLHKKPLKGH